MDIFRTIAERRIQEAIARGELDELPLAGRPIRLNDMDGVPEEDRLARRVLRNANVLPEEVQLHREIRALRQQLRSPDVAGEEQARLRRALIERESLYNLLLEQRRRR